jgi:protein-S-isoprenylcysteine O-methyltransferase Ste14
LNLVLRAILAFGLTATYLGLAVLGWGSVDGFFAHPAFVALTVVSFLLAGAASLAGGSLSAGLREDRENRWVIPVLILLGLLSAYLPAYTDRIDVWTFDGETVRWLGVLLAAIGGALRLWPVFILGLRFSGLVAIQPGHALVTTGLYGVVRHPSYLGLLVGSLGWALVFRSIVGLLLLILTIPVILARIRAEEALLKTEFGAGYEAYRRRTSRLIPGFY